MADLQETDTEARSPSHRWRWITIAGAATLAVASPYILTLVSPYSVCWSEYRLSDRQDKIADAKRYLTSSLKIPNTKLSNIVALENCCDVTKGGSNFPNLNLLVYLAYDNSHYVVFPIRHAAIQDIPPRYRIKNSILITVDTCGRGINEGVNL